MRDRERQPGALLVGSARTTGAVSPRRKRRGRCARNAPRSPSSARRARSTVTYGNGSASAEPDRAMVFRLSRASSESTGRGVRPPLSRHRARARCCTHRRRAASCAASCPRATSAVAGIASRVQRDRRERRASASACLPSSGRSMSALPTATPSLPASSGRSIRTACSMPAYCLGTTHERRRSSFRRSARCPAVRSPSERAGIDACVHCGFCLQACPTYLTLEDENDSPRGRIVLMRALLEGTLAPDNESVETHIAPMPRLPRVRDGVSVRRAVWPIARGHARDARRAPADPGDRARDSLGLRAAVAAAPGDGRRPSSRDASGLARLLARLPGRLGFAMAMLASTRRQRPSRRAATRGPPDRARPGRAAHRLRDGGSVRTESNRATERVLTRNEFAHRRCPGSGMLRSPARARRRRRRRTAAGQGEHRRVREAHTPTTSA